jgi:hypothetical protein
VGHVRVPQEWRRDTLCRTCVYASGAIWRSHSAFCCIRGVECQHTIFILRWARCRPTRSVPGHIALNMCFCILHDLEVTLCILLHPGRETSVHNFSCMSWMSCSMFWCVRCAKHRSTILHTRVGLIWVPQEACWDPLRRTCALASCTIWRSHSAFWCV